MYEIMHARMYKTCMYLCTVCNRSDIIMYVCLYVCMYVCMYVTVLVPFQGE